MRREKAYMVFSRLAVGDVERDMAGFVSDDYDRIVLTVMKAIASDKITDLVVSLHNDDRLPEPPHGVVIEALCRIGAAGPVPLSISPLPEHAVGLVQLVGHAECAIIRVALEGSLDLTVAALARHPPIDSVGVARELLERVWAESLGLGYPS